MCTSDFACLTKPKHKKIQSFNKFYYATRYALRCALRCVVLSSVVNFVVHFYLRAGENKFHVAIYSKEHFVMIYIFKFYVFERTFLNFYILFFCLFSVMFARKSMEC